ncbi:MULTISPECIES: hypothetical protein [unclassified Lentimonas]|uniref:hypothetical protein n=1 Tax=unclassified Lentimonas TaxID=2630993 RepID=UPI0013238D25|nr:MULTISPECIES: hypothetical protein [unclassified Lentimonas]CAA6680119.1 Unannotated [Lentimonas sp. CC4]CAA6685099.1 Unannotated [Lentimonas sp. CC6]CAA6696639.1 Unannotated [Lentimonas sp. CC10]CAA6697435.1 Unannotated [Lentimonas sp. CC19]CAA7072509.1 Unannotated [Lentimonas sp. CC11]
MKRILPLTILLVVSTICYADEDAKSRNAATLKAYELLSKGDRIASVEALQINNKHFGYYFLYRHEGIIESKGIVVGKDFSTYQGVSSKEILPFKYDPPRIQKITSKKPIGDNYNMPVVIRDSPNYK